VSGQDQLGDCVKGFAVIDLETTGFAYKANDRVCEIGVVLVAPALVNAAGRREDSWATLVNPQRDLGAQHVHRIDASFPVAEYARAASSRAIRTWHPV